MMEDEVITQRISAYSCCMGWAMYARMKALQDGDVKGAEVLLKKAMLLQWATRVLSGYTLSDGKCKGEIPSTEEEVQCAIDRADPCCPLPCGCCDEEAGPDTETCDIAPDHTALSAVIASARLEVEFTDPDVGDSYLITSGENDVWTAATIQTWNGTGWTATALTLGDVIDVAGTLWTYTDQGVKLLYPPYNMQLVDANGTYQFAPVDPAITVSMHRNVEIQTFNGEWLTVFATTEDALYGGLAVPFGMLPFSSARIAYLWGRGCRKTVDVASILPPQLDCGIFKTLLVDVENNPTVGDFKLKVTVDTQDFLIGDIELTWTGGSEVHEGADGVFHYGPWPVGTQVQVTMHNKNNPDCDIDLGVFSGGQCFVPGPVCQMVDASFEGSSNPLTYYFIATDTTLAGNTWSSYVGFTVIGGAYTGVPIGGEVQLGALPEQRVIWTGSEAVPVAPQIHVNYDADTLYYVSQYPQVHALRTRSVLVEGHSVANGWFTIYSGPEAALGAVQTFPYNSLLSIVDQVRATYTWGGCSLMVAGDDISEYPDVFCGIASTDAGIIADIGDMVSYMIYPQIDTAGTPTKYGPATIYVKSDAGGVLSGNPSAFETAYGAAPSFGVGDVVRFELALDTFKITSQVVLAHLPNVINNLADVSLDFSPLPEWNGDPSSYPVAGLYKRNPDNTVSHLFQAYSIAQTQPDEVTLTATAPAEALLSPNSARVEYTVDGTTWVGLGTYTDVALAAGVVLAVDHFATELRTTCLYNDGNCEGQQVTYSLTPLILDLVIPFSERAPWGDLTPQRRYLWRSYDRQAWTRTQWPYGGIAMSGAKELGETVTGSEPLLEYSMAASMHRDQRISAGLFASGASGLCWVRNLYGAYPDVHLYTEDLSSYFIATNPSPPPSEILLSPYVTALLPEEIVCISVFSGAGTVGPPFCLVAGNASSLYLINPYTSAVPLTGIILTDNEIIGCAYMDTDTYLLFCRNNSWRTTDGGATWTEMPLKVGYLSIALDSQTALVMATASDDSKTGLFRTTDAGLTWTWINTAVSYGGDTGGFSACSATAVCRGGLKSLDGGLTWDAMNLPAEVTGAHRVLMLSEDIIILATNKVWYSVDGGATFRIYPVQPPDGTQTYAGIFAALTGWKANY